MFNTPLDGSHRDSYQAAEPNSAKGGEGDATESEAPWRVLHA
jgi:hypothetical protein